MAKRSIATARSSLQERVRKRGFRLDNSFLRRELPVVPPQAFLFRRFRTFADCLRFWAAESSPVASVRELKRSEEFWRAWRDEREPDYGEADKLSGADRLPEIRRLRRRSALRILDALGDVKPFDYLKARRTIHEIVEEGWRISDSRVFDPYAVDPRVTVAGEVSEILSPLLDAYSDPRFFFEEKAPILSPGYLFAPRGLMPASDGSPSGNLDLVVWTWGRAVIRLNTIVRRAFRSAPAEQQRFLLSIPNRRKTLKDGRPRGSSRLDLRRERRWTRCFVEKLVEHGKPKWGSVGRAFQIRAAKEGVTPWAIKKRLQRGETWLRRERDAEIKEIGKLLRDREEDATEVRAWMDGYYRAFRRQRHALSPDPLVLLKGFLIWRSARST